MTNKITNIDVTIYYLKMDKIPENYTTVASAFSIQIMEQPIIKEDYLSLYKGVGDTYQWTDRLSLTDNQLLDVINNSKTRVYRLLHKEEIVGFSELVQEGDYIELLYFGLLTDNIGKGLGPSFLQMMITEAWEMNPQWVQLNTCSLDHPKALSLYQSMGFSIQETKIKGN